MGRLESDKLRVSVLLLLLIVVFGTVSYSVIEGMTPFDSFYMTLITISTVGFSEIMPLTRPGRIITVIIIISGISLLTYTLGQGAKIFIEGELRELLGRRKLEKKIASIVDHYIICGFGRIGEVLCAELAEENIPFVVIEKDLDRFDILEKEQYLYLKGDATDDDILLQAGLKSAKGIATVVSNDSDNVFITLTAKGLRPDIFVLSRASDAKNETKLIRAGASRVVCPFNMGGLRMAQILKKPTVVDFIDSTMMSGSLGLTLEEATVMPGSELVGKSLINSHLRRDFGIMIVAIKKSSNSMVFNPGPNAVIEAGDVIVSVGKQEDMARMNEVLS